MELIDGAGRRITYLRISLTDKCNLRCRYCTPPEGVVRREHSEMLSLEEQFRLIKIFTRMGISKVRFTGGEPLLRKNLTYLIRQTASLASPPHICMTTNGLLLTSQLTDLYEAGLRDINVSLDTVREDTYEAITGRPGVSDVIEAVNEACSLGMTVKINCVPMKGINEEDIIPLVLFARDKDISLRFIELMPMGCAMAYEGLDNDSVRSMLRDRFREEAISGDEAGGCKGPAEYVRYEGFKGRVGFISPMSHRFCGECNRIRLSCDGKLRLCLYSSEYSDLRDLLRKGYTDEQIESVIRQAVMNKPLQHEFKRRSTGDSMIGIGG